MMTHDDYTFKRKFTGFGRHRLNLNGRLSIHATALIQKFRIIMNLVVI